ncbi:hypothetical protein [Caballeronia arvi]|uniref:hypothetical protein n=1 Tax=Caballeronia arvi TaxID=1777135 RepID=UPI00117F1CEA|nr:hypothetical protein [Caballeronia arvi]
MADQPQQLTLPPPRTYTRTDFTSLRALVQRLPAAPMARLYSDPERSPHAASADAMERFLGTMRDDPVHLRCCMARRSWPIACERRSSSTAARSSRR